MLETINILHSCGHWQERNLTSYNPHKKTWENIRKLLPSPPANIEKNHVKRVNKATIKANEYWQNQVCLNCYKNNPKDGE